MSQSLATLPNVPRLDVNPPPGKKYRSFSFENTHDKKKHNYKHLRLCTSIIEDYAI